MKVLVFGAGGWLGQRFVRYFNADASTANVCETDDVFCAVGDSQYDLVINAAGVTHSKNTPSIDACIASDAAMSRTCQVNAMGAGIVAAACARDDVQLVHLSSGCIFNGYDRVFAEDDEPNPVSWYARTKVLGDRLVRSINPNTLILRIRMPISAEPHPRNLITKLAKASRVVDVLNSVTVVEDLLDWTKQLVDAKVSGIVHAVNPRPILYRELMSWYQEIVDPSYRCEFIPKEQFVTTDGRSNCVLSTRTLPIEMQDAETSVKTALAQYAKAAVQPA